MVPLDSGITGITGLRGKRIGYTDSSLQTPFLDVFFKAGGLTKADVELVDLEGAATLGAYLSGKLDAAFSAIPFLVPAVNEGRPSHGIGLSAAGLVMPSYGVFARDATIAAKRDALVRFVTVTDAAWAYIIAGHQDEGVAAIRAAHLLLAGACGNPKIVAVIAQVLSDIDRVYYFGLLKDSRSGDIREDHLRLIEALTRRDGLKAECIMRKHIETGFAIVLDATANSAPLRRPAVQLLRRS